MFVQRQTALLQFTAIHRLAGPDDLYLHLGLQLKKNITEKLEKAQMKQDIVIFLSSVTFPKVSGHAAFRNQSKQAGMTCPCSSTAESGFIDSGQYQDADSSKEMNCFSLSRYCAYSSMSLWPAPSTQSGSTARGQRSYMASP